MKKGEAELVAVLVVMLGVWSCLCVNIQHMCTTTGVRSKQEEVIFSGADHTGGVVPPLTLHPSHNARTHTQLSLQVTSVWVCLVNMPSLPSRVQGECGAFIRLIKGRGQICP